MSTRRRLQAFTLGVFPLGLVGAGASLTPAVPFFWTGDESLFVGGGLLSLGVVVFADLRRRNWDEEPTVETA